MIDQNCTSELSHLSYGFTVHAHFYVFKQLFNHECIKFGTDKTSVKADREDWGGVSLKPLQNTGKMKASGTTPTRGPAAPREPTKPPKSFEN